MRLIALVFILVFLETPFAQSPTLTLRAKLRDFKDYLPADTATHPDFENDAYMDCGGTDLEYVRNTIALDGQVDTTLFRGDNRGPVLQRLTHRDKPAVQCFTSLEKFGDWYNDKPTVNRSFYTDLVLTRNAQGLYTFNDDDFLPLNPGAGWQKFRPADPEPFGPRPDITPNDVWGFTMELHTTFTYLAGQNQVFTFKGDDDVWVFINDRLAIDLGGLHPQLTSTVNLDAQAAALGLVDGGSYPLDFFFAERHSTGSHCQITTSLQLIQMPPLPVPVATPSGQTFRSSIQVAVTVPGHPDAQIRYTTDGTEPTATSPIYPASLTFPGTTTLKAKAFKADFQPSPTLTEVYTLEQVKLPTPVALPSGRIFDVSIAVGLSVPGHPDAVIRYTVNGLDPDSTSPVHSSALTLTASDTVKARAFKAGWLASEVMVEVYQLRVPANVITLRMDTTLIRKGGDGTPVYPDPVLRRPIAVVSLDRGTPACLDCPAGAQDIFLQPGRFPEWEVSSRYPFRYFFHIYDHLGQFVVSQNGEVTQEMLGRSPGDAAAYRVFRFRWVPVSHNREAVGTGAYILRGKVVSENPVSPTAGPGRSETTLLKTFGYVRSD